VVEETGNWQQATGTNNWQQATDNKRQATGNKLLTTNNWQQATNNEQ
jgi:hypothetical protein